MMANSRIDGKDADVDVKGPAIKGSEAKESKDLVKA